MLDFVASPTNCLAENASSSIIPRFLLMLLKRDVKTFDLTLS